MKQSTVLLLVILSVVLADKYAIIFQGDREYYNYSDSSNTCRAYDDILASGIPPENIIYMMNDDVLVNKENPWPNKLFTLPDPDGEGIDHASVCKEHIDYTGAMIKPSVVLAILRQDVKTVKRLTLLENPKVFNTTEEDTIFVYYSDHGYRGGVGCGSDFISATDMIATLKELHDKKRYSKLAFFLESCQSGSVFKFMPTNLNIYAFTSANYTEPAWSDHCPPDDVVNGKSIGTCMSMFYDNEWQRLVETETTAITLGELKDRTHDYVAQYKTQEVSEWGDLTMRDLPVSTFLGEKPISFHARSTSASSMRVEKSQQRLHEATWRAIRSTSNGAMDELREVIYNNAKQEIEAMRLGVSILGEKLANKVVGEKTISPNDECVSSTLEMLMKKCHHSLPFPQSTNNIVNAICNVNTLPAIDWDTICM